MTTAQPLPFGPPWKTRSDMAAPIDFNSISRGLTEIGRGGEGLVYLVQSMPNMVFKEFKQFPGHTPNRIALEEIINLPTKMEASERQWIMERTTWPLQLVTRGANLCGFMMPVITNDFFRMHGARIAPKKVTCEWNYLSMRERFRTNQNIHSEIPQLSPVDALKVVGDLARTMEILHKYDMVIGAVSGRNLLWTDRPAPRVLVIDVDSFHFEGKTGVASPKQSPDWDDPYLGPNNNFTTKASDKYKLALAAYRGVWAATTDRPDPTKAAVPSCPHGVPDSVRDLVTRGLGPVDNRPEAREWVEAIQTAMRFGGRPTVTIDQTGPSQRPTRAVGDREPTAPVARPVIKMKPTT